MKKFLALALTAFALASCQEAPTPAAPAPITFGNKAPIRLNVAQINVIENYHSPMRAPNVDHTFPTPPVMALKQWAGQRLAAAGSQGMLEMTIEDASVIQTDLPKTTGITGFFTNDQSARYDATIHVTLRLYDGVNTIYSAQADVNVTRMHTIDEKATVAQREALFNTMLQDMMIQFDSEAEARLRQYFANYIVG